MSGVSLEVRRLNKSWGSVQVLDSTADTGHDTDMIIVNGNPAITYADESVGYIWYLRASSADGSSWNAPIAVAQFRSRPDLAIIDGYPAMALFNWNQLYYIRSDNADGSSWSGTEYLLGATANTYGNYPQLLDRSGLPRIYECPFTTSLQRGLDVNGSSWLPVTSGPTISRKPNAMMIGNDVAGTTTTGGMGLAICIE